MTTDQIIAIKKRKGTTLTIDFIKKFAKEWDAVVEDITKSGADLSEIVIVEEPIRGKIKGMKTDRRKQI